MPDFGSVMVAKKLRYTLLMLLALLTLSPSLTAQSAPAPFTPVSGSSIDSVNLETGELQVAIPLWSIKQRGNLSLSFTLRYQSPGVQVDQICTLLGLGGVCNDYGSHPLVVNCGGNYVVCGSMTVTDNLSVSLTPIDDLVTSDGGNIVAGYYWQLSAPDGSTHKLASTGAGTFRSTDGTGWLYNEDTFMLISQDGVRYAFICSFSPCTANTVPNESPYENVQLSYIEDTNGNQIHINLNSSVYEGLTYFSPSGSYTDTFGRTIQSPSAAVTSSTSACPTSPNTPVSAYTWTVPGYSGNVTFTFCYANVAIATNFFTENTKYQASGYKEISGSATFLQSVILPDSNTWGFSYNNPNSTTVNFGDLTQITLPTGGTISYAWNPTHSRPQLCSIDNNPPQAPIAYPMYFNDQVTTRTLSSGQSGATGTWTYSIGPESVASGLTTTVKDPTNAYVTHTITGLGKSCSYYDTQEQAYNAQGTLLKTETHGYTYQPDFDVSQNLAYPNGAPPYMMNVLPTSNTVTLPNGATKQTTYAYNYTFTATGVNTFSPVTATIPYGLPTSETHYDYGQNAPGTALSQRTTSFYASNSPAAMANNLIALPWSVTDTDMVTNQTSTTNYGYDAGTLASGTATPNSGSSENGWNSTPLAGSIRGNQTSIQRYWDTNGSYLTTTKTFYNTGLVASVAEPPNSAITGSLTTNYTYSSTYDGAYLTTLTDPQGNPTTFSYDSSSGLLAGSVDPNSISSTYSYYPNMKLESAQRQGGDHNLASSVSYTYPSSTIVTKTTELNSTTSESDTTTYDGLGRVIQTEHNDPEGNEYVDTTYDTVGRVYTVSTPYRSKTATEFYGLTRKAYDGLSRVTSITNPDNTSVSYIYTGATTQLTNESNGNTTSQKLSRADGLGRLTSACEVVTSKTPAQMGGDTPASCGLEIAGTGFLTIYTQTLRGMTESVQGAQTRTFSYDSLNRLTQSTNPETGTIGYIYDADGNLITKTSPGENSTSGTAATLTTHYNFNNVHQIISKTYLLTGASSLTVIPTVVYNYGQSVVDGITIENPIGRLTSEYTTVPAKTNETGVVSNLVPIKPEPEIQTESIYSYDTDGRVASHYQCVLTACQNPVAFEDVEYHYDGAGNVASFSTPQAGYSNTIDSAGHLTNVTPTWTVDANHPASLLTATYAPNGGWLNATLGNGTVENYSYTPRWLTGMSVGVKSGTGYSYSLSRAGDSQITRAADSINGTWNYTYDDFNRLITAQQVNSSNAVLNGLSWDYDRYGNRWHQNNTAGTVTSDTIAYNTASNQATSNLTYDIAGNVTDDGSHAYVYDQENRIATVDGTTGYIYDAEGRRVAKSNGTVYVISISGTVIDELDNGVWTRTELYAGGHHIATANASATVFIHADWLGTERARTNMSGVLCQTETSQPFGDNAVTGTPVGVANCSMSPDFFTGKPRDTESNLDDFGARYLSSQWGRWMSPDWSATPSGVPYATLANPQSLNLYAYVGNDPIDGEDADGHVASLTSMSVAAAGFTIAGLELAGVDLTFAEAGNVAASSDTSGSSSAGGTGEAQAGNNQSQTTPASAPVSPQQQIVNEIQNFDKIVNAEVDDLIKTVQDTGTCFCSTEAIEQAKVYLNPPDDGAFNTERGLIQDGALKSLRDMSGEALDSKIKSEVSSFLSTADKDQKNQLLGAISHLNALNSPSLSAKGRDWATGKVQDAVHEGLSGWISKIWDSRTNKQLAIDDTMKQINKSLGPN
jgi:RHS repeat-associated protein